MNLCWLPQPGLELAVTSSMYAVRLPLLGKVTGRVGLALLAVLLLASGCRPTPVVTNSSDSSSLPTVSALGRIQPLHGVIDLSAAPGDRVEEVKVKEGELVRQDQTLIVLESHQLREGDKELAEIQLKDARARLGAIERGGTAQKDEAEIRMQGAKDATKHDVLMLEQKRTLLDRQLALAEQTLANLDSLGAGTVSEQDKEKQRLAVASTRSEIYANTQMLEKAKAAQDQAEKEGQAQLVALGASLQRARLEVPQAAAEQNLKLAEDRLKQSFVTAPSAGVILNVLTHKGEVTGGRPLLQLGDTSQLAVIAEVDESDILRVKPGQEASIESPTLNQLDALKGGKLKGTVKTIGLTFGRNQVLDQNPAAQINRRVVDVTIALDLKAYPEDVQKQIERMIYHQVHVKISTTQAK